MRIFNTTKVRVPVPQTDYNLSVGEGQRSWYTRTQPSFINTCWPLAHLWPTTGYVYTDPSKNKTPEKKKISQVIMSQFPELKSVAVFLFSTWKSSPLRNKVLNITGKSAVAHVKCGKDCGLLQRHRNCRDDFLRFISFWICLSHKIQVLACKSTERIPALSLSPPNIDAKMCNWRVYMHLLKKGCR